MASNAIISVTFLWITVLTADCTPSPPLNAAGNFVQCFASNDCSGSPSSITATAKQCCVGSDDSLSYMAPDGCNRCIVHGFRKAKFDITEGQDGNIEFVKNVKGQSRYGRLGLPLLGNITSTAVTAGASDFSDIGVIETDNEGQAVFAITANDDDTVLESTESVRLRFTAFYTQFTEELESVGEYIRDMAYVHIIDNDGDPCYIGFTLGQYTVSEGAGSVSVCVNLTCPANKNNSIRMEVYSDDTVAVPRPLANGNFPSIECEYTAEDFDDYEQQIRGCNKMQWVTIEEGETLCYDQIIYDDARVEPTEYTGLTLLIKDATAATIIERGHTVIQIEDDDSGVVGLESGYYFSELAGSFQMCATWRSPTSTRCPFEHSFSVPLSITDNSADIGSLLDPLSLLFEDCQQRSCVEILIHNDYTLEDLIEVLTVSLEAVPDLSDRIILNPAESRVLIIDDDVLHISVEDFSTSERNSSVEVCARLSSDPETCRVDFEFDVVFSTQDVTATSGHDYESISTTARAMPCQPVICTEVTIIDDETVELLEETFTVRLERTPGLDYRISLEDTPATITITDDDVTRFGLRETYLEVYDNETEIEVCVEAKPPYNSAICPVGFQFNLNVSIQGTGDIVMTVEQCAIQKCVLVPVNISAVNHLIINLEPPANHDNRIELVDVKHNIIILSTFGPTVEFERRSLTVQEEDGRAEVCVLVTAHGHHSELTIPITLSTSDVTAVAGQDYRSLQSILRLDPCDEKVCFDVAIINDARVEDMEQFTLSLVYDFGSGGDVKEDKVDIWINDTDAREPCGILPYITLGVTEGVDTLSVAVPEDRLSEPILTDLPLGYGNESTIYVASSGYFTFKHWFYMFFPYPLNERIESVIAPFFTTVDVYPSTDGQIRYEVHRDNTSEVILSQVNQLINNCSEKEFTGNWLLVATWENVSWYPKDILKAKNTFQGILVTDSVNSYAVFTYYCGDLSATYSASIGFSIEDGLHEIHEATFRRNPHLIACLNSPRTPWVNVIYNLTNNDFNACLGPYHDCEQICNNSEGSYACDCREGHDLNTDGRSCSDINECLGPDHGCEYSCENTVGSYTCGCDVGFELNTDGRTCRDIDECLGPEHGCQQICENTVGSYYCNCSTGYVLHADGLTCDDIDECSVPNNDCEQECENTIGSYICKCSEGYEFDTRGSLCLDVDECLSHDHGCEQVCENTAGSYVCNCSKGYNLNTNGHDCDDVNECLLSTDSCEQVCENTIGSFECICREGYVMNADAPTCQDIDECSTNGHGCEDVCINSEGSYSCGCSDGYTLNEDGRTCSISCGGRLTEVSGSFHTPDWPLRYPTEDFVCEWVIDIENTTDSVIEITFNEPYGINGRDPCPTDYVEVLDGVEDNSPSLGKHCFWRTPAPILTSSSRAKVVFQGSHLARSASRVGVSIAFTLKQKVNECENDNGGCAHSCQDSPGSYSCSCLNGFILGGDKHNCSDIDECSTNIHGCQQVCVNTEGSYSCECRDGYALDDNGMTCSISCGGSLLDSSGSFQTPDWPDRYPQADFICEWTIDMSTNSSIQFTVDSSAYGINGRHPCQNDHLEFFNGLESDSRSLGRFCKLEVPPPITTSTGAARIVFEGRVHQNRPASRKGVRVVYTTD